MSGRRVARDAEGNLLYYGKTMAQHRETVEPLQGTNLCLVPADSPLAFVAHFNRARLGLNADAIRPTDDGRHYVFDRAAAEVLLRGVEAALPEAERGEAANAE